MISHGLYSGEGRSGKRLWTRKYAAWNLKKERAYQEGYDRSLRTLTRHVLSAFEMIPKRYIGLYRVHHTGIFWRILNIFDFLIFSKD
jgi:hypothetical protein